MGAIRDLWSSERGLVAVALIVGATVLASIRILTADQWVSYTEWIFVTYAASKTVTGSVAIMKSGVSSGTPSQESPGTRAAPAAPVDSKPTPVREAP